MHMIIEIFGTYLDSIRYQSKDVRAFMEQCRLLDISGACAPNKSTPPSNAVIVVWLGDGPSCHGDVLEWRDEAMERLYTRIQRTAATPTPPLAEQPTDLDLVVLQLSSAEAIRFMGYVRDGVRGAVSERYQCGKQV